MPITDIGSYVPTGHEFEAHWTDVNTDRMANALPEFALPDGYTRANFTTDVAAVETEINAQESLDNGLSIATNGRDSQKTALRDRLIDFRKQVDYQLKGSIYATSLPDTPLLGASEQKFLRALTDMEDLWTRINADTTTTNFTPPLVFSDGYALAQFQTDVAALRAQYQAVIDAENDAKIGRKKRDELLEPLRDRFVLYREGIEVEYGESNAFTQSLPDVYSAPGSTPDGVDFNGAYDLAQQLAAFNWGASSDPNFLRYQVRVSPGSSYDTANATVVESIDDISQLSTTTTQELANPGDTATFRLYVMTTTGNEKGSNQDVTITRP